MFLNSNSQGISYLEELLKSATEVKKFLDQLKEKFNLDDNSSIWDINAKITELSINYSELLLEYTSIKEDSRYSQESYTKLLAELAEKELSSNIANFTLYELISSIVQLVNSKSEFQSEQAYFEYVLLVLDKLKDVDVLKRKDTLAEQAEEINKLKTLLENRIEEHLNLKHQIMSLFPDKKSNGFENDFIEFKEDFTSVKDKAAKYDYLLSIGAIKEVGNTISSKAAFYVTYGK